MCSKIKILILFILVSIGAYAQDSLYFSSTTYNIGIHHTGDSTNISDSVVNLGGSPFIGTVSLSARIGSTNLSAAQFNSASLTTADTIFPGPANAKLLAFNIVNNGGAPFAIGPNTIVIWPIIHVNNTLVPANPLDTVTVTVYYYPLGIKESPLANMYIFEAPGMLNIHFGDAENLVQQVRIINMLGQDIYSGSPENSKNIPTAGWSMGIYLCEITIMSGDKRTFKFRLQ